MKNLFKNKKGIEFTASTIGRLLLMLIVVFIVIFSYKSLTDAPKNFDAAQIHYKQNCDVFKKDCEKIIKNCQDKNVECESQEELIFKEYQLVKDCDYFQNCKEEEKVLWEEFKERHFSNEIEKQPIISNLNYEPTIQEYEKTTISSSFDLDSIISKHSTIPDINKIKSIIIVETKTKPLDDENHPTLRFECHKFNKYVPLNKVHCTIKSGESFSRVSSETNKDAFLKAKAINERAAILSTSFGFGQVMGFNYNKVGYDSPEKFYKDMFDPEKQVIAMIKFIESTPILKNELSKINSDWAIIARNYNGPDYILNDYDKKLENTYNSLS